LAQTQSSIYSSDYEYEFECVAETGLPPALQIDDQLPLREGRCWCLDRFWDGRLRNAVNILSCKRLEDAAVCRRGDTEGICRHASIPLRAGEELLGVLNVASPGKTHFNAEELALLQSISLQIGTAAHRIRLYRMERKRANMLAKLGEVTRGLSLLPEAAMLEEEVVSRAGEGLCWPLVALFVKEQNALVRRVLYADGKVMRKPVRIKHAQLGPLDAAVCRQATALLASGMGVDRLLPGLLSGAAVPLLLQGQPFGVLAAGSRSSGQFDAVDVEVLEALAAHVALTFDSLRLHETNRELARFEERNRIARDLHDSVSQTLFSLSLHAKGLEQALPDAQGSMTVAAREVQRLSQSALGEMRAMIRQLRPTGLEEGLLTGLRTYGEQIGVRVSYSSEELRQLPDRIENALWRIGQEALNNIMKHAGIAEAEIALAFSEWNVTMKVSDRGAGMKRVQTAGADGGGFGMTTMRERAEALGGTVTIRSRAGRGTDVTVRIPL
jgi:hypothetical protein